MNIIRLLLIGGLIYFAVMQKKESTRNMILIVTGFLAVCMISKEGFTVSASENPPFTECDNSDSCTADGSTNTVTVTASDGSTFTFKNGENYSLNGNDDSTLGSGENRITCTTDGTTDGTTGFVAGAAAYDGSTTQASIRTVLVCTASDSPAPTPPTPSPPPPPTPTPATLTQENLNKICNINHYETDGFFNGKKSVYVFEGGDGRCCSCGEDHWFDGVNKCGDDDPCPTPPPPS
jgi:hypothetical protein